MVFSSFNFIFLFLPALLVLYFLIPARHRGARNCLLLAFSLFFYGYGGPKFLLLMLASITINYCGGLLAASGRAGRKLWLAVTLGLNLLLLGWFKYAGFAADALNAVGVPVVRPDVVLPIGISFFTFQGMSYVLDVSRGDARPERNPLRIALYISLFPQLVAGPIVRYTTIADEIVFREESADSFTCGCVRFLFGLAKKLLIANGVGVIADAVYQTPVEGLTVALAWLGSVSYTLQIYFDFSGYSDMAIGLGQIFGFHFPENFLYPYVARSLTDFWRRWHISLSSWFRDYVYIPLGGNRRGTGRQIVNLLIVWFLTGLWHGAAWNFVLWGLYYAVLLIGERFLWGRAVERVHALGRVYALFFVNLGWVLFRANGARHAFAFIRAMFGNAALTDGRTQYYLAEYGAVLILAILACLPWKLWLERYLQHHRERLAARALLIWGPRLTAIALLALSYGKLLTSSFNPFIYFRF